MAENRLTQAGLLVLTENTAASARLNQAGLLALTENSNALARVNQLCLMVLTDPPPTVPVIITGGKFRLRPKAKQTLGSASRVRQFRRKR
jgi:hypothetical protein